MAITDLPDYRQPSRGLKGPLLRKPRKCDKRARRVWAEKPPTPDGRSDCTASLRGQTPKQKARRVRRMRSPPRPCSRLRRGSSAGEPQSAQAAISSLGAEEAIRSKAAVEVVVARVSAQLIVATPTEQPVGSAAAGEDVGRSGAAQRVAVARSGETLDCPEAVASRTVCKPTSQVGHDTGA